MNKKLISLVLAAAMTVSSGAALAGGLGDKARTAMNRVRSRNSPAAVQTYSFGRWHRYNVHITRNGETIAKYTTR